MKFELGFGTGTQTIELPETNIIDVLKPNLVEIKSTGVEEVQRALETPIASPVLREIVKAGEKIAIISSDITRPMPTHLVMPILLDELYDAGVKPEDITLVFGLGSHRKQSSEERRKLAGERAWQEITCIDGDSSDCIHLGRTSRGTPVDIVRVVAQADRRICLGNIEYHYFAGYSGGTKAIMPGVSTRQAIQSNHSLMVDPKACSGKLDGNPVREDIEEAVNNFCPVDFILNVVLDEQKQIIHAVAGHPVKAHRVGCEFLDKLYRKDIPKQADIVVVSQGGAPKDLNLYQTQKALDNAKHAVKKGGIIILVGSCKEGLGEQVFEEWMKGSETSHAMIERIQQDFQLGGHKAAAIALVLEKAQIYLVSEMDEELVKSIFLTPFKSAQAALNAAFDKLGKAATVLIMPYGGSTLPVVNISV
jgi:nickel-dependent lactate racemase